MDIEFIKMSNDISSLKKNDYKDHRLQHLKKRKNLYKEGMFI